MPFLMDKKAAGQKTDGFSLSKKSSENWAFSFGCGKIKKKGRKSEGNAGNRTDEQR